MDEVVYDISDLKGLLGKRQQKETKDLEDDDLKKIVSLFFKLDDKNGLTKTDIPEYMVLPFSMILDFVKNPLPLYNEYLKKNKEKPIRYREIEEFLLKIYIKALISKNRLGRHEGKEVLQKILEKSESKEEENGLNKMFSDLAR